MNKKWSKSIEVSEGLDKETVAFIILLRDILKDYLPDEIRLDRKKIGFNASINDLVKFNKKQIIMLLDFIIKII